MNNWSIGLELWIIGDGNYKHFQRGQIGDFALQFYPRSIRITQEKIKSAILIEDDIYRAVAEVVFHSEKTWILDFGLCAFDVYNLHNFRDEINSSTVSIGDFLEIEFSLGLDPFYYFEQLHKVPGIPPIIYEWRIDSITAQTGFMIKDENNNWRWPDRENCSYSEVEKTDGPLLDEKRRNFDSPVKQCLTYILNCTQIDEKPKFQRTLSSYY